MKRTMGPAADPPSFPEPIFATARRIHGWVETPGSAGGGGGTTSKDDDDAHDAVAASAGGPPTLMRRNSVTGNVLLLKNPQNGTTKAFLLQRKVGTSAYGGSIRVGFRLTGDKPGDDGLWHVVHKDNGDATAQSASSKKRDHTLMMDDIQQHCELVTVYIENETTLAASTTEVASDNLQTELAALQWIAKHSTLHSTTLKLDHLWGTTDMGNDSGWLCTILSPWHSDGTLLDYCASHQTGTLEVEEAKFFFRQIVAGLQQLQAVGMCHRSLSMETILLEGKHCRLTHYGSALRIPTAADGTPRLIAPQPVGGRFPESVAPELWAEDPFDGYAVDLWSAGIILWKMLVTKGLVPLFAAPVPDDFRFRDYCVDGKLPERLRPAGLPEHVVDLLKGLLRANPSERYTLLNVLEHPWLAEQQEMSVN